MLQWNWSGHVTADLLGFDEGLLPSARAAEVDRHLQDCSRCAQQLRAIRDARETLRAELRPCAMPEQMSDAIRQAIVSGSPESLGYQFAISGCRSPITRFRFRARRLTRVGSCVDCDRACCGGRVAGGPAVDRASRFVGAATRFRAGSQDVARTRGAGWAEPGLRVELAVSHSRMASANEALRSRISSPQPADNRGADQARRRRRRADCATARRRSSATKSMVTR